ncbi:MAG: hypothetical protein PHZ19_12110 [Candidatus Thermoplasmatota archaeon]|nr:hypothetical protein [Candidatus Thermoplasmatota archaeon]
MSEQQAANGEARQRLAVIERVQADCISRQDARDSDNRREHTDMFGRLNRIDVAIAQLTTRLTLAAGLAAFVGAAAVQIVVKLILH